jgi:sialidase-1
MVAPVRLALAAALAAALAPSPATTAGPRVVQWKHLSTATGDLAVPNAGDQQTSLAVADFDGDGTNDFAVTERTKAPSVVLYRRTRTGWDRMVVDDRPRHIEAGSEAFDIDGDGDPDLLVGGDGASNEVWWYENPSPRIEATVPWTRRVVKDWGATKHHDQAFGDFDGDGAAELAFWNQGGRALYVCEVPAKPRAAERWACAAVYTWSDDSEMLQRQTKPYPAFKAVNEHEGLAAADIDGDGVVDIVGGGRWFKHRGGTTYDANVIDASYQFTRAVAGQLVEGGRPEVVLTVGDGWGPLVLYEWRKGVWVPRVVLPEVDCTHSVALVDFDRDGHLDIWVAEMRLDGGNPDARSQILFGDGRGGFEPVVISEGFELHESEMADLDGDGDLDVVGKPYGWSAPRLDVWINEGEPLEHLFRSGDEGYRCFRIPAIVTTNAGALLAFAEGRRDGCGDTGDIDLVLKRSEDGGRSWGPLAVVWSDGTNTCGNPAPVVDRRTGRVFLLSTWNLGVDHEGQIIDGTSRDTRRVFVLSSEDDGRTWSEAREITPDVKKPDWTWYATGPVNGIQLRAPAHRGRLVVPCDHVEAGTKRAFSHTIHSDDGGETWMLGGSTPADGVNESTVAELPDGTLVLNMRNHGALRVRQVSLSRDGGATWSAPTGDDVLVEPVCQASLLWSEHASRGPVLAFSNPASRTSRRRMTVRLSHDGGRSWGRQALVHAGPSAYSNLVTLPNGNLAILFEGGASSPYEGIVFRELPIDRFEPVTSRPSSRPGDGSR